MMANALLALPTNLVTSPCATHCMRVDCIWQEHMDSPSQCTTKENLSHLDPKQEINETPWIEKSFGLKGQLSLVATEHCHKEDMMQLSSKTSASDEAGGRGYNSLMFTRLCQEGRLKEALQFLDKVQPSTQMYACLLRECTKRKSLKEGKEVHEHIIRTGFESDILIKNILVDLYGKCGNVLVARKLFNNMAERNVFSWTALISGHALSEKNEEAVGLYKEMQQDGVVPDKVTFVIVLKACTSMTNLELGRQVHAHTVRCALESDIFVENALVDMYAKCGSIQEARTVFNGMDVRDAFSWTAMIVGYSEQGHFEDAFTLFKRMQHEGMAPDKVILLCILKACIRSSAFDQGRWLHAVAIRYDLELDLYVASTLVDMYATCGSIVDACRIFNKMGKQDVVSWNVMIAGYANHGFGEEAMSMFEKMQEGGLKPDIVCFIGLLKACTSMQASDQGQHIHAQIIEHGFELDFFLQSTLVDMYTKCSCMEDAYQVFNKMNARNVIAWTAIITGHVQQGRYEDAASLFEQMVQEGIDPDEVAFLSLLKACTSLIAVEKVHMLIRRSCFEWSTAVGNTLVGIYGKFGSLEAAYEAFDNLVERDVISWNGIISMYAEHGLAEGALKAFDRMQREGVKPDQVTLVNIVKACTDSCTSEWCKEVHALVIERGFYSDVYVGSRLINMYFKFGSLDYAQRVFASICNGDIMLWTGMIAGYCQHGCAKEALALFEKMQQEGLKPEKSSFISVLKSCTSLEMGKQIHALINSSIIKCDIAVGNSLIDMYAKCGSIHDAREVFNNMQERDVVSWTVIIDNYTQHGLGYQALVLFEHMSTTEVKPDEVTFASVLKACTRFSALDKGKEVHMLIIESGFELDGFVRTALVDMYANCGSIGDACRVFNKMYDRSLVVPWNAMIAAYAQHGKGVEAVMLFEQMRQERISPTDITFISVLSGCSHAGLLDEGRRYYKLMREALGITPTIEHYACMVDLLCRSGHLGEAEELIESMPLQPTEVVWRTLLGACRVVGNVGAVNGSLCSIHKITHHMCHQQISIWHQSR